MQYCITVTINYILLLLFKLSGFFLYVFRESVSSHFGGPPCRQRIWYCILELLYPGFMCSGAKAFTCTRKYSLSGPLQTFHSCLFYSQLEGWWDGHFMSSSTQQGPVSDSKDEVTGWMWVQKHRADIDALVSLSGSFLPLGDGDCVRNFKKKSKTDFFFSFYRTDEPKNVIAGVTPLLVKEGQRVTFSCSARGQPYPNFTWFQNGSQVSTLARWSITSVALSQNGSYYCVAKNTHGEQKSEVINLIVQCKSLQYFTIWNLFFDSLSH